MKNVVDTLKDTPFSLVLSGGGALGIAQFNRVDVLRERGKGLSESHTL